MLEMLHLGMLDAVIIGVVLTGLVVGFFQGVVRQVFLLAAVYFGMVLAAQYYLLGASIVALAIPGGEPRAYSTVGLILTFVLSLLTINAVGYHVYSTTRLPILAAVDRAGGSLLGVVSAWLFVTLMLTATNFALAMPIEGVALAQRDARALLDASRLRPIFHQATPALYETLRPWVPSGLPAPFAG